MPAYNFHDQFAPAVENGQKRQTIRADRKDGWVPRVGMTAYLFNRMMRKECRKLGQSPIVRVDRLEIERGPAWRPAPIVVREGRALSLRSIDALAKADGFESVESFVAYFETSGLPFRGHLIRWGEFV